MLPDHMVVGSLFGHSYLMVVQSSIGVVVVGQFREIPYSLMRLLENRDTDGNIVGRSKILSIFVLEVFFLDVPK